jgi:hypothetical protein
MTMKKFTVALDPSQVERLRDAARQRAARERQDWNWVRLLREAADHLLTAEAGRRQDALSPAGGRQ